MRISILAAALAFLSSGIAFAAMPAPGAAPKAAAVSSVPIDTVCSGCGCRGGAGYRLPSGKCAPRGR
jgi:hypothetical protein